MHLADTLVYIWSNTAVVCCGWCVFLIQRTGSWYRYSWCSKSCRFLNNIYKHFLFVWRFACILLNNLPFIVYVRVCYIYFLFRQTFLYYSRFYLVACLKNQCRGFFLTKCPFFFWITTWLFSAKWKMLRRFWKCVILCALPIARGALW